MTAASSIDRVRLRTFFNSTYILSSKPTILTLSCITLKPTANTSKRDFIVWFPHMSWNSGFS